MKIKIFNAFTGKVEEAQRIKKPDVEWQKILTPQQYRVTRQKATEKPFTGMCELPKEKGIYKCVGCNTDLFSVKSEFESGTGWPSFWEPVSELNIKLKPDNSFGMNRIEVFCARCEAHLGHVFDDGPPPTGKRYCINSAALKFIKSATFAAGCFWGVEAAFKNIKGVVSTRVGYTGGHFKNPTYEDVCSHTTGHAEAVEVAYDPSKISYEHLLEIFWNIHDPTMPNRQGADIGSQYRSAIFYHSQEERDVALASKEKLVRSKIYKAPIVTEIVPLNEFYPAEEYHQNYYARRRVKSTCLP